MFGRLGAKIRRQAGYTLTEMLVALAVLGIVAPAMSMAVIQILGMNELATNHMTATKQTESAIYWISHDAKMAQTVQTGGGSGFPLYLGWSDWNNTSSNVTYTIQDGELIRAYSVNGTEITTIVAARNIDDDSAATSCNFTDGVLSFKVTIAVEGFRPVTETRIGQVVPKSQ